MYFQRLQWSSTRAARWVTATGVVFAILAMLPPPAAASEATPGVVVSGFWQEDLDGDGRPDLAIIDCSFVTAHDQVLVFDSASNMEWSRDWTKGTDFSDDIWVFDAGADGRANLIILFSQHNGSYIAHLYDDQSGDGVVSYKVTEQCIEITEGPSWTIEPFWTVEVASSGGWRLADGSVNFALNILVDGQVRTTAPVSYYDNLLVHDGSPDFDVEVIDVEGDGTPDYELRRVLVPVPEGWGINRSLLRVNPVNEKPPDYENYLFWPYLGDRAIAYEGTYGRSSPPILVDWGTSKIVRCAQIIPGVPFEVGWTINTLQFIDKNALNYVNFENPMAYYDLANDRDHKPELHVRIEYNGPNDPFFLGGMFPQPMERVRYSWDQDNDDLWDFKIDLLGRNEIDSVVSFPDFSVEAIPYDSVPYWVTESPWDAAGLIEVEDTRYVSSEGIYEAFGISLQLRNLYLTGLTNTPPLPERTDIRKGLRGEYTLSPPDILHLYFSPVDRKLHLLGAEKGLWIVNDRTEIEYDNLDGDGFLDCWRLIEQNGLIQTLIADTDYVLYADEDSVRLRKAQVPLSLFTTLPPRDHSEWKNLGALLEQHSDDLPPDDLRPMFDRFTGPSLEINSATMRDFRLTSEGFRFVLRLAPDFDIDSELTVKGLDKLEPGDYLLTYNDGSVSLAKATPPNLYLNNNDVYVAPAEPQEMTAVDVGLAVTNEGLQDAHAVALTLTLTAPDGCLETLTQTLDLVPGQGQATAHFEWVPSQAGRWKIKAGLGTASSRVPEGGEHIFINIQPAPAFTWCQLLGLGLADNLWWLRLLLFASIVLAAAMGVLIVAAPRSALQGRR